MIAVMVILAATAIRMTDEHLLCALAEGSDMSMENVHHLMVGRPKYIQADADACKVLRNDRPGVFAPAPDGKGMLYDLIINFLPNANLVSQLRTRSREMDLGQYAIPN